MKGIAVVDQQPHNPDSRAGREDDSPPSGQSCDDGSEWPAAFGFRSGERGPHASRSMMLNEITDLLEAVPDEAPKSVYREAIMEDNVLGKRTIATRRESYERLGWLYALDPGVTVFRLLRFFWQRDHSGRPMLALLCASTRDPLLRMTANTVLTTPLKETLSNTAMEEAVAFGAPGRFNEPTQIKIARNAAASWTHAGFLQGRRNKIRVHPHITPGVVAYALTLGYLTGASGQMLLSTFWAKLLDTPRDQLTSLAADASARGWIAFRQSGQVVEVRFADLLTPEELEARLEQD